MIDKPIIIYTPDGVGVWRPAPKAAVIDTVPEITPRLIDLCATVSPHRPVMVTSRPFTGAISQQCYRNVALYMSDRGGRMVTGWTVWEDPGVYLSLEHHAVWRSPEGDLLCVSPQMCGERRVVFVRQTEFDVVPTDDELARLASCHTIPLSDDPTVRQVCDLFTEAARDPARGRELRGRGIVLRDRYVQRRREREIRRWKRRRGK